MSSSTPVIFSDKRAPKSSTTHYLLQHKEFLEITPTYTGTTDQTSIQKLKDRFIHLKFNWWWIIVGINIDVVMKFSSGVAC